MSEGRTVMNVVDCASIPESRSAQEASLHRVLIVGAGAGGLELATRLGNTLGKRKKASIAILDKTRIRVWKPHLHEVASGTLDVHVDSIEYIAHARTPLPLSARRDVRPQPRQIYVEAMPDDEGRQLIPPRVLQGTENPRAGFDDR